MAIERIGEVQISATKGSKKSDGRKAKVLKLRIPHSTAEKLGIVRSKTPIPLYIDPEIEIAEKTGIFSLIYKFDIEEIKKNSIPDNVRDDGKVEYDSELNGEELEFDIGDIVGEKNGVE